jgi:hypothetical protein
MRDGYSFDDTLSYGWFFDTSEHTDARGQQAHQVQESYSNHLVGNGSMEKFKQICKTLSWKYIQNIIIIVCLFQQIDISLGIGTFIVFKNKIRVKR